jgi:hypothetical protein
MHPTRGARSLLLSGGYRLDWSRPHRLLAALPELLHVPADPGRHQSLRAAIALLGEELESARPGRSAVLPVLIDAMFPLHGCVFLVTEYRQMSPMLTKYALTTYFAKRSWSRAFRDAVVKRRALPLS